MLSQSCRTLSAPHLGLRTVSFITFSLKEHGNSHTRLCSIIAITIVSCGNVLLCNPVIIIHYSVHIKEFVMTFLFPYITELFYQGFIETDVIHSLDLEGYKGKKRSFHFYYLSIMPEKPVSSVLK
jgi:hypothetical protein